MPTSQVLFSPAPLSQLCLLSSCVATSGPWGCAVERDSHQMGRTKLLRVWAQLAPGGCVSSAGHSDRGQFCDPVTGRLPGSPTAMQHHKQSLLIPSKIQASPVLQGLCHVSSLCGDKEGTAARVKRWSWLLMHWLEAALQSFGLDLLLCPQVMDWPDVSANIPHLESPLGHLLCSCLHLTCPFCINNWSKCKLKATEIKRIIEIKQDAVCVVLLHSPEAEGDGI